MPAEKFGTRFGPAGWEFRERKKALQILILVKMRISLIWIKSPLLYQLS